MAKNIQAERIKGTFDSLSALTLTSTTVFVGIDGVHSNVYSGNSAEAFYYGDGSNLTNIVTAFSSLTDTNIVSPEHSSIPMYNTGTTKWENNNPTSHMKSVVISSWTLLSGDTYYYDFLHGLGTLDLLWNLRDTVTNSYVFPTDISPQDVNTLRVLIGDNTSTLNLTVSDAIYGITNTSTRTIITKNAVNYSAVTNDIVWGNPSGGTMTIYFPDVSTNANLPVSVNNIGINNGIIVIDGNGAQVNGLTGFTLYNNESIEFYNNGIEWRQHN